MQSTGLFDKNGKEIFEGDITTDGHTITDIKYHQTLGFYTAVKGTIVFFGETVNLKDFDKLMENTSELVEIIGNIYENPELLEVTE